MARAKKDIAGRHQRVGAPAPVAAGAPTAHSLPAPQPKLALRDLPDQHRKQILALIRAMARDAARADHAAGRNGDVT